MRPVRKPTKEEENFRMVRREWYVTPKRDPVEPEPVGTIVLEAFRITGYDRDCDGSLMARLENIDSDGEATGWEQTHIGIGPKSEVVVTLEEWQTMFAICHAANGDAPAEPAPPSTAKEE